MSDATPDWDRERPQGLWDPSRRLLRSIRGYQRWKARWGPLAWVLKRWYVLAHTFWSVVTGTHIPPNSRIGGGLLLPHPNGVVIHPDAVIGPNCLLFQQVTIGTGGKRPGTPTLGCNVDVGAGAKVLGGVTIGDGARIGANAVVLCDVPPGSTAVGVPARVLQREEARTSS